jgi:hypothetical protein
LKIKIKKCKTCDVRESKKEKVSEHGYSNSVTVRYRSLALRDRVRHKMFSGKNESSRDIQTSLCATFTRFVQGVEVYGVGPHAKSKFYAVRAPVEGKTAHGGSGAKLT